MYTANEALEIVRNRQVPDYSKVGSKYPAIDTCILDHINRGWLCANIRQIAGCELFGIRHYLEDLGYQMDRDGIVYWMFKSE